MCTLALAGTLSACANKRPVAPVAPAAPPSTRDIETLIEQGCFRCLERALALADERAVPRLAFEAAALLVLRATELGMPADTSLARARALATEDPERAQYLEMVEAVPPIRCEDCETTCSSKRRCAIASSSGWRA